MRELGRQSAGIVCDVTDSDQIRSAITEVHERFGRIDVLVNNAGGVRAGLFMTQPEPSIRRHVEINLISMLIATQEAARHMIDGRPGRGDRQCQQHRGQPGRPHVRGLRGVQGGHDQLHPDDGGRAGRARYSGQLHLTGSHRDPRRPRQPEGAG